MLVRTNSYLVRTIVHVYCFPWPRVQLSFVSTLVRTKECWYVQTVDQKQLYVQALILYVQSRFFCSCKAVVRAIVRAKVFHFIEVLILVRHIFATADSQEFQAGVYSFFNFSVSLVFVRVSKFHLFRID